MSHLTCRTGELPNFIQRTVYLQTTARLRWIVGEMQESLNAQATKNICLPDLRHCRHFTESHLFGSGSAQACFGWY